MGMHSCSSCAVLAYRSVPLHTTQPRCTISRRRHCASTTSPSTFGCPADTLWVSTTSACILAACLVCQAVQITAQQIEQQKSEVNITTTLGSLYVRFLRHRQPMLNLHRQSAARSCITAWPAPWAWLVASSCSATVVVPSRVLLPPRTITLLALHDGSAPAFA